tara:strand:- start:75 stop:1943 length:1869 start_codon:yes stop_codon:yes gene_type:complete
MSYRTRKSKYDHIKKLNEGRLLTEAPNCDHEGYCTAAISCGGENAYHGCVSGGNCVTETQGSFSDYTMCSGLGVPTGGGEKEEKKKEKGNTGIQYDGEILMTSIHGDVLTSNGWVPKSDVNKLKGTPPPPSLNMKSGPVKGKEKLKEGCGCGEAKETSEDSYMAASQLHSISNKAQNVYNKLERDEVLDDWMESHLAKIDQMMDSVNDSFEHDQYKEAGDMGPGGCPPGHHWCAASNSCRSDNKPQMEPMTLMGDDVISLNEQAQVQDWGPGIIRHAKLYSCGDNHNAGLAQACGMGPLPYSNQQNLAFSNLCLNVTDSGGNPYNLADGPIVFVEYQGQTYRMTGTGAGNQINSCSAYGLSTPPESATVVTACNTNGQGANAQNISPYYNPNVQPCNQTQTQGDWWCDPTGAYVNPNGGNCTQSPNQPQSYFTGPYTSESDCNTQCSAAPTPTPRYVTVELCDGTPYGSQNSFMNMLVDDNGTVREPVPGDEFEAPAGGPGAQLANWKVLQVGTAAQVPQMTFPIVPCPNTSTTGCDQSAWSNYSTWLNNFTSLPNFSSSNPNQPCQFLCQRNTLWGDALSTGTINGQQMGPNWMNQIQCKYDEVQDLMNTHNCSSSNASAC